DRRMRGLEAWEFHHGVCSTATTASSATTAGTTGLAAGREYADHPRRNQIGAGGYDRDRQEGKLHQRSGAERFQGVGGRQGAGDKELLVGGGGRGERTRPETLPGAVLRQLNDGHE